MSIILGGYRISDIKLYQADRAQGFAKSKGIQMSLVNRNEGVDKVFDRGSLGSNELLSISENSGLPSRAGIHGDPSQGSNAFSRLGEKLNERTEKLSNLENKFQALSNTSKSLADAVKGYNEKESKKKWWQL